MPIIDLQRQMVEVGRIRMGRQVEFERQDGTKGKRAAKLDHFRLTGRDQSRLAVVAELYGGTVEPWADRAGEFEVYTTAAELPIFILPGQTLSQWWELWSGGGCSRRCDGVREILSDEPCLCDADTKRKTRQCKPTTRLSVMLPDVPGLGVWRLESHGYYAAVELAGTAAMLETATARGVLLPARLRIDQRTKVEGGKTTKYAVPVIDLDITARAALMAGPAGPAALEPGEPPATFTPLAPGGGVSVADGLNAVDREREPRARTSRSAADLGPEADDVDLFGDDQPIPVATEEPIGEAESDGDLASDAQRKLLWTVVRTNELPEERLRAIVQQITGQPSTKAIPRSDFEEILRHVEHAVEQMLEELAPKLVAVLEAHAKERGKLDSVQTAIYKNRANHDLAHHVAWMKRQIELATATPAAA